MRNNTVYICLYILYCRYHTVKHHHPPEGDLKSMLRGYKYLWRLDCNTGFAGAGGNGLKSTRSGQNALCFFQHDKTWSLRPTMVRLQKRGQSRLGKGRGKERKEVVTAENNCGVGSCEGSVNSNKSQILFFLVTGAADVRRVKVRANCLQSECF